MGTYFDKREGRWKHIPDCAKHGLVWDEQTQRCERKGLLDRLFSGLGKGLGFIMDEALYLNGGGYGDYYDYGYYEPIYYEPVYEPPPSQPAPVPAPAPAPAPEPPPVYTPAPVYQPVYEPVSYDGLAYYEEPEPFYEPSPPTPIYQPPPVYVEPELIEEEQVFFELPYVAPEPEPIVEEFFELPYIKPEPLPTPAPTPAPVFSDWTFCANENQRCEFPDTREVRYGKGSSWTAPRQFTGGVDCSNAVFGDPLFGTVKECQTRPVAPELVGPPIPEPVTTMAEDFYIDDYGGGGYYNGGGADVFLNGGGGGGEFFYDPGTGDVVGDTFYTGDIFGETGSGSWTDSSITPPPMSFEEIPFAPYEPVPLEPPRFEPVPELPDLPFFPGPAFEDIPLSPMPTSDVTYGSPFEDVFFDHLDHYLGMGYDLDTAYTLAEQDRAAEVIASTTEAPLPLPDIPPFSFSYIPTLFDPFQFQPPEFEPVADQFFELPYLPPSQGPCNTPDGLPPYCPQGMGRGPLGSDPCLCYPLPAPKPPAQTQQPKPPAQTTAPAPKPPAQQTKPPAQQQPCPPTTHWVNPATRRCEPIPRCRSPLVFDQRTGRCVPTAQASQLPPPGGDVLDELKKFPWWVWLVVGGGALFALSGGGKRK